MKIAGIMVALMALAMAAPALAADSSVPISPDPLGPGTSAPEVFLMYRAFDIGIDEDGSGSTINPVDIRNANYAFEGEKLYYVALVRDLNGRQDIETVKWIKEMSEGGMQDQMGPCDVVFPGLNLADVYTFCELPEFEEDQFCVIFTDVIDTIVGALTNLDYDYQTDEMYMCILTVESIDAGWDECDITIEAEDTAGETGRMLPEDWIFNPPLSIDVDTNDGYALAFGERMIDQAPRCVVEPDCERCFREDQTWRDCMLYTYENCVEGEKLCDISFSTNKLVIRNVGIADLWTFIAASDFYDSTGMAKCPHTNQLSAEQFEYRATQGTWDSGWRIMPRYAPDLACQGPMLWQHCRGGCRIAEGCPIDVLSPTHTIEVAFKVVWPTPCIGTFDTGNIYVIVRAV
jgi:hypothetical protein